MSSEPLSPGMVYRAYFDERSYRQVYRIIPVATRAVGGAERITAKGLKERNWGRLIKNEVVCDAAMKTHEQGSN